MKQNLVLIALVLCVSILIANVECSKKSADLSHELTLKDLYILEKLFKTYIKIKMDEIELENGRYSPIDDIDINDNAQSDDQDQIKIETRNLKRPSLLDRLKNKLDGDLDLLNKDWD